LGVLVGLIAALMISAELRSRRERLGHELRWLWVSVTTFVLTTVAVGVILAILFYWLVHGGHLSG
jgi:Flp pilus assembly pilin Flp